MIQGVVSGCDTTNTAPEIAVAIRCAFSTCNASGKEVSRHYPMFRHRSATPAGVTGNGEVRSLGDNVTSINRIGRERASRHGDCQHHGGRGPTARGRVNPGEVLLKAVSLNKPKMLCGLNQTVRGQVQGLDTPLSRMKHHRPKSTT